jgi:hypothetical protein
MGKESKEFGRQCVKFWPNCFLVISYFFVV